MCELCAVGLGFRLQQLLALAVRSPPLTRRRLPPDDFASRYHFQCLGHCRCHCTTRTTIVLWLLLVRVLGTPLPTTFSQHLLESTSVLSVL